MRLTTSWDDGHPLDLRLAELLEKHRFRGTFYVPCANREGRPVMDAAQKRTLASRFEIGAHTLDHVRLDEVSPREARHQIAGSKAALEQELGRAVTGFCYPGGRHDRAIRGYVKEVGFRYARTIENFSISERADPFRLPTTIQMYPHRRATLFRNLVSGRSWGTRASVFLRTMLAGSFDEMLDVLLRQAAEHAGVFHLWGHSWEIDEMGLWAPLERFLSFADQLVARDERVDNAAVAASMRR